MKKAFLALSLLLTNTIYAGGYSQSGNVYVFESGNRQFMQANMSVRYNTSLPGDPYMLINGYANQQVTFAGLDSEGEYFSCYVHNTSPLYRAAVDAKNNADNGTRLYVYKDVGNSQCINFSLGHFSYYLD